MPLADHAWQGEGGASEGEAGGQATLDPRKFLQSPVMDDCVQGASDGCSYIAECDGADG